ncbi:MAG: universal stress protein [Chloroflexi bacterium]|nr:universal stress protein [Chloroflexota bacterium]
MYSKVVVPLDGSELSERSLPYARLVAGALSVPIDLVEAFDVLPAAVHDHLAVVATQRMLEEAQSRTDNYLGRVRADLRDMGYMATATTLPGAPAQAIVDWVADDPDALVVMSTHGRGGIARWALGSVADKVLHAIPNPMLLVRGAAANPLEDGGPRAILAPLDGSTLSELSLEHAATMATALKTRIVLMRVNPDAAVYRDYLSPGRGGASGARDADWAAVEELIQNELTDTRDSLDRSANRLTGEFGFVNDVVTLPVESRNVAEAIAEAAASEGAMVVMTTHGRSGINRLVMGSVTDRVVRHSDLPVLVVRQAETPSAATLEQRVTETGQQEFGGAAPQPA